MARRWYGAELEHHRRVPAAQGFDQLDPELPAGAAQQAGGVGHVTIQAYRRLGDVTDVLRFSQSVEAMGNGAEASRDDGHDNGGVRALRMIDHAVGVAARV